MMRFAHISDLHFGSFSLSPFQFFSKRWVGNFNYLLTRRHLFSYNRLISLISLFKREKVTHILITGDFTVTGRKMEFKMGQRFVQLLEKEGFTVFTIPGNHDHYTKRNYRKKHFYSFFNSLFDPTCPLNLKDDKVTYTKLQEHLWLVALDTAVATSLASSEGYFSKKVEENLEKALAHIPSKDTILLLNHYPFFQNDPVKKQLVGAPMLKNLIQKHSNILLYLHGHTHRQVVADLRPNDLPILSDSGSTPHIKNGGCHLFQIQPDSINLQVYRYDEQWKETQTHNFNR